MKKKFKWFASQYNYIDVITPTILYAFRGNKSILFHTTNKLFTQHINLHISESTLLSHYDKNTRYEVNRAKKENITYKFYIKHSPALEKFVRLYNNFASDTNLKNISIGKLLNLDATITVAQHQDEDLVLHCYILDRDQGIVRLLHSVSLFRTFKDSSMKKMCGWGNRGLHHHDIIAFKEQGLHFYDFGGIATGKNLSTEMKNINQFKLSFGGEVVEDIHLSSYPLYLAVLFANKIKGFF